MSETKPIIEQLMDMWKQDSIMDETEIRKETVKISRLHAKYLNIKTQYSLKYNILEAECKKLTRLKRSYYRGEITDPKILEEHGWEQWQHNKVLNSAMDEYLDTDSDLIEIRLKLKLYKEIMDYCIYVLKELNNRTYQCKNLMDSERWFSGNM